MLKIEWGHPDDDGIEEFRKWRANNDLQAITMRAYIHNNKLGSSKREPVK